MAAPKKNERDRLLIKFERLKARADAVDAGDRKQLIALLDDITTLRDLLNQECQRIDEKINRSMFRTTAITAYGRGAQAVRAMRRGH